MIKENLIGTNLVYRYNDNDIILKIIDVKIGEITKIYVSDMDYINKKIKLVHDQNVYIKYFKTYKTELFLFRRYCTCCSDYFDYPYYLSCTMDAYQNLISGDKRSKITQGNCSG